MSDVFVSIDLGTTRLKAAVFKQTGELLHQVTSRHKEGGNDADAWWSDAIVTARIALDIVGAPEVGGISLSGRAGAGVFTDAAGKVLVQPWSDNRHGEQLKQLKHWREGRFLSNYGAALIAKYQWLCEHEPATASRVRKAFYAKDFLLYRLTGEHKTDWSSGPDRDTWGDDVLAELSVPEGLLPTPSLPWQIAGPLSKEAAAALDLKPGIPVAVGAHDGICANVGAGATRPGEYAITLGTHAVTRTILPELPEGAYRFYTMPPDRHVVGGNAIMGGRSADWFADITHGIWTDRQDALRIMDGDAAKIAPGADGARFLPFLSGQVAPELRLGASGAFFGLRAHHERAHLFRSVLEGTAFAVGDIFDQVVGWCGEPSRIRLTGGGASSAIWTEILANVLGRPLELSDAAVEGRGAVIFLAVALGLHRDYDEAADAMVPVTRRIAPNPQSKEAYRTLRESWQAFSAATKPLDE